MDTEEKKLFPIILFAFNRLAPLKKTIKSLLLNEEAKDSILYIFVDGARVEKPLEKEKVQAVQSYVKEIKGFKSVHYFFCEQNKGLGNSIIQGVGQIINQYGKAIVLEDDLILSSNFLSFMNEGLKHYQENKKVFSICGWGPKIRVPANYNANTYFCVRSNSWGWGTWADRWNSVDWELTDWNACKKNKWKFNKWGGSDCFSMLNDWKKGRNKSWAIRFTYAQFIQDKFSLFPFISKVDNKGFDDDATNCPRYCRTKWFFENSEDKTFIYPSEISIRKDIYRNVMWYRNILVRIYAKLINLYLNLKYNKK